MKTSEEIIKEIERRINSVASTPSHLFTDSDQGKQAALEMLLDWIEEEQDKNKDDAWQDVLNMGTSDFNPNKTKW